MEFVYFAIQVSMQIMGSVSLVKQIADIVQMEPRVNNVIIGIFFKMDNVLLNVDKSLTLFNE
jgi:hypothetical protein